MPSSFEHDGQLDELLDACLEVGNHQVNDAITVEIPNAIVEGILDAMEGIHLVVMDNRLVAMGNHLATVEENRVIEVCILAVEVEILVVGVGSHLAVKVGSLIAEDIVQVDIILVMAEEDISLKVEHHILVKAVLDILEEEHLDSLVLVHLDSLQVNHMIVQDILVDLLKVVDIDQVGIVVATDLDYSLAFLQ